VVVIRIIPYGAFEQAGDLIRVVAGRTTALGAKDNTVMTMENSKVLKSRFDLEACSPYGLPSKVVAKLQNFLVLSCGHTCYENQQSSCRSSSMSLAKL
jgi:hypothetical protein